MFHCLIHDLIPLNHSSTSTSALHLHLVSPPVRLMGSNIFPWKLCNAHTLCCPSGLQRGEFFSSEAWDSECAVPREPLKAVEQGDVVVVIVMRGGGQRERSARESYCFCNTCAYGISLWWCDTMQASVSDPSAAGWQEVNRNERKKAKKKKVVWGG